MPRRFFERKSVEERFWKKVDKCEGGCWEWRGSVLDSGYGHFFTGGKMMRSHRVSYELHHPLTQPIQDIELYVLHDCDNRKCVNPSHLRLGTQQDNMTDMTNKGRCTNGKKQLNEQQVIEIRTRYTGFRGQQQQFATEYGVSHGVISNIIRNRRWTHLQPHSPS